MTETLVAKYQIAKPRGVLGPLLPTPMLAISLLFILRRSFHPVAQRFKPRPEILPRDVCVTAQSQLDSGGLQDGAVHGVDVGVGYLGA